MFAAIVCCDIYGGIGYKNQLLFHIKEDMKRFKNLTTGHKIIMGRKTFESLPHGVLPNRTNIVLTNNENIKIDNAIVSNNIKQLINLYKDSKEVVFIIGGSLIYQQFLPYCQFIYLTYVHEFKKADCFINLKYIEQNFKKTQIVESVNGYSFIDYIKPL